MFRRLLTAEGQSRSAKTVEIFGWLIMIEGTIVLFAPHFSASVLGRAPLADQSANYFRLAGLLVGGTGMLYIASGRLNAEGFVLRFHARPAAGSHRDGDSLVLGRYPWSTCFDFLNSSFRKLYLDIGRVAWR